MTIQCIFALLSGPAILEDADFGKKIIFSDEAHYDLGCCVNRKIVTFGAQKTRTLKIRRTQNELLFDADNWRHNWAIFLPK